ncbi:MAG: hypothetical protein A2W25_04215 [candidate division Zixibacteria bacterium RBG_16_53_22]|nr:MAG: hypothetical protein A2W25_04215 [candidate division Zixibacteria bacterium RBG_16_53_22]
MSDVYDEITRTIRKNLIRRGVMYNIMEPVNPGWLVVAAIIGGAIGIAVGKSKTDIKPADIPTDLAYFASNKENLFPTDGIVAKHVATSGYAVGQAIGKLWK